jgi:hypothetical protein
MTRRSAAAVLAALLLASLPPSTARADGPPPTAVGAAADADELKRRGDEAMDALRYDDALALYHQAWEKSHDPRVLYNMGRIYLARGQHVEALASLEAFVASAPPDLVAQVPGIDGLVAEVRQKVATVVISSSVAGAAVTLSGHRLGTTPLGGPVKVEAGPATLDVAAAGYQPYHRDLVLPGGAQTVVDAVLVAVVAARGVLSVRTAEDPAQIFVDGRSAGESPIEVQVAPGQHVVVARREGREAAQTSAVVGAGERKDVTVAFASGPSVFTRWWFWTGVGVVVAGGAALTYALLTEKKASVGDNFQPGQVAGPLVRW